MFCDSAFNNWGFLSTKLTCERDIRLYDPYFPIPSREQKTLELREAQRKIQELSGATKLTSIPEKPQSSSTASPRKRSTSFSVFSSFLGSRD